MASSPVNRKKKIIKIYPKKQEIALSYLIPRDMIETKAEQSEVETAPELLEGDIAIPEVRCFDEDSVSTL